jgi:hypothetical protein
MLIDQDITPKLPKISLSAEPLSRVSAARSVRISVNIVFAVRSNVLLEDGSEDGGLNRILQPLPEVELLLLDGNGYLLGPLLREAAREKARRGLPILLCLLPPIFHYLHLQLCLQLPYSIEKLAKLSAGLALLLLLPQRHPSEEACVTDACIVASSGAMDAGGESLEKLGLCFRGELRRSAAWMPHRRVSPSILALLIIA